MRAFLVASFLLVAPGCGSDSSSTSQGGCESHYDCPAGESCGTADGTTFACHASGPGQVGDACNQNQNLPLQCGDHLVCLGLNGGGSCRRWCSANDPCPSGTGACTPLRTTHGVTLSMCL